MKTSIYIATLMAAFGLLGLSTDSSLDAAGKEPVKLQGKDTRAAQTPPRSTAAPEITNTSPVIASSVEATTAGDAGPHSQTPAQPHQPGEKSCGPADIPASFLSSVAASRKMSQTPLSCRQACGSDTLCYICCLHPDPRHCQ